MALTGQRRVVIGGVDLAAWSSTPGAVISSSLAGRARTERSQGTQKRGRWRGAGRGG